MTNIHKKSIDLKELIIQKFDENDVIQRAFD